MIPTSHPQRQILIHRAYHHPQRQHHIYRGKVTCTELSHIHRAKAKTHPLRLPYITSTGTTRWSLNLIYRDKISYTEVTIRRGNITSTGALHLIHIRYGTISSAEATSHPQRQHHIHRGNITSTEATSYPQRLHLFNRPLIHKDQGNFIFINHHSSG
jgi:hypothetical protein